MSHYFEPASAHGCVIPAPEYHSFMLQTSNSYSLQEGVPSYGAGKASEEVAGVLMQCDAVGGDIVPQNWKTRCSFPTYIIALAACAGLSECSTPVTPCLAFALQY